MKLTLQVLACTAAFLVASVFMGPSAMAAGTWKCTTNGRWSRTAPASKGGAIRWDLALTGAGSKRSLSGKVRDRYGTSRLKGTCTSNKKRGACTLIQTYTSGKLKGQKYRWKGTYKGERMAKDKKGRRRMRKVFEGKWFRGGKPAGTWSATAICTKVR